MTEREQMELAAKAAGLAIEWVPEHNCYWIAMGQGIEVRPWDPRNDDGDCFRLQLVLGISLNIEGGRFSCRAPGEEIAIEGKTLPQAVRSAIVYLASCMGRRLKH